MNSDDQGVEFWESLGYCDFLCR